MKLAGSQGERDHFGKHASRRVAIACSSTVPVAPIWPSATPTSRSTAVLSVSVAGLAVRLHRFRLFLGELAQAAQEILGDRHRRAEGRSRLPSIPISLAQPCGQLDLCHETPRPQGALLQRLRECWARSPQPSIRISRRGGPRLDVGTPSSSASSHRRRSTQRLERGRARRPAARPRAERASSRVTGRERAEVDPQAQRWLGRNHGCELLTVASVGSRGLGDRLELVVEIHGVT